MSPDQNNGNGEVQRFEIVTDEFGVSTGVYLETVISGLGTPAGLAFIEPVPEPSTWALMLVGMATVAIARWRRKN